KVERKIPEEATASEAENRAPDAVEIHGNDGELDTFHDAFHAAAEREHLTDASHLAFGENTDQLAILQGLRGFAKRMDHFARTLIGSDGNDSQHFRERLDQGMLVRALE